MLHVVKCLFNDWIFTKWTGRLLAQWLNWIFAHWARNLLYSTVTKEYPHSFNGSFLRGYSINFSLPRLRSRVWNRSRLCVCVSVCSSVSALTVEPKIWQEHCLWSYLGQVQKSRSKVKVAILKNWFSNFFLLCDLCRLHTVILSWHLTSCDVTAWRHAVTWRHGVTSWHPLTTFGQEYWQRGHVAGGRANAQAFSYDFNHDNKNIMHAISLYLRGKF